MTLTRANQIVNPVRDTVGADRATKADLYQVALVNVVANAAITFSLLNLVP